jgi:hypothetical protein
LCVICSCPSENTTMKALLTPIASLQKTTKT